LTGGLGRTDGLSQRDGLGFEVVGELTTGNTLHLNLQETMKLSLPGVRFDGAGSMHEAALGIDKRMIHL